MDHSNAFFIVAGDFNQASLESVLPKFSGYRELPQHCKTVLKPHSETFSETATYASITDLQKYTESITGYIIKCIDDATVVKTINGQANQKPWLTREVFSLLRACNAAFKSGDTAHYSLARKNLTWGIIEVKRLYAQKLNSHFTNNKHSHQLWQRFQTIIYYNPHVINMMDYYWN